MPHSRNRLVFTRDAVLQALQASPMSARALAQSANAKVLARLRDVLLLLQECGEIKQVPYGGVRCWALAAWVETDLMFVQRMQAECVMRDGCMVWRGYVSHSGVPSVSRGGRSGVSLRRLVYEAYSGRPVSKKFFVRMTCGNDCCLDAAHMERITRSKVLRGVPKSIMHRIHCAEAARLRPGAIGIDNAEKIRNSELSDAELAHELGCDHSTVNAVRNGRTYKTYTNPFGLMGSK